MTHVYSYVLKVLSDECLQWLQCGTVDEYIMTDLFFFLPHLEQTNFHKQMTRRSLQQLWKAKKEKMDGNCWFFWVNNVGSLSDGRHPADDGVVHAQWWVSLLDEALPQMALKAFSWVTVSPTWRGQAIPALLPGQRSSLLPWCVWMHISLQVPHHVGYSPSYLGCTRAEFAFIS